MSGSKVLGASVVKVVGDVYRGRGFVAVVECCDKAQRTPTAVWCLLYFLISDL